jgi:UDP-N-acetylmuramoyl-L-alanine---L-glutamate ligase
MKARIATRQYEDGIIVIPFGQPELEEEIRGVCSTVLRVDMHGNPDSDFLIRDERYCIELEGMELDLLPVGFRCNLPGAHNRLNALCAASVALLGGIGSDEIEEAIESFESLPHRIELLGRYGGVDYYNDSIATVPQATIAALNALGFVDTLILGGFDRGIAYSVLYSELENNRVQNVLFMGPAGRRMWEEIGSSLRKRINAEWHDTLKTVVARAQEITPIGGKCLLSPAAASYDQYSGFEARGDDFRSLVGQIRR